MLVNNRGTTSLASSGLLSALHTEQENYNNTKLQCSTTAHKLKLLAVKTNSDTRTPLLTDVIKYWYFWFMFNLLTFPAQENSSHSILGQQGICQNCCNRFLEEGCPSCHPTTVSYTHLTLPTNREV